MFAVYVRECVQIIFLNCLTILFYLFAKLLCCCYNICSLLLGINDLTSCNYVHALYAVFINANAINSLF